MLELRPARGCAGAPLPRTPTWAGGADYEHVFDLPNNGTVAANVDTTFATSRYLSSDFYTPESKANGYFLLNANLTYASPGDVWSITGFVNNITNATIYQGSTTYVVNGFSELLGGPASQNYVLATVGPPRTYGVRASFHF